MADEPHAASEHYTREYFEKWNYADRGLGRFSMYWFARRYYAALVRRYAPRDGGKLLEWDAGWGICSVSCRTILAALAST